MKYKSDFEVDVCVIGWHKLVDHDVCHLLGTKIAMAGHRLGVRDALGVDAATLKAFVSVAGSVNARMFAFSNPDDAKYWDSVYAKSAKWAAHNGVDVMWDAWQQMLSSDSKFVPQILDMRTKALIKYTKKHAIFVVSSTRARGVLRGAVFAGRTTSKPDNNLAVHVVLTNDVGFNDVRKALRYKYNRNPLFSDILQREVYTIKAKQAL